MTVTDTTRKARFDGDGSTKLFTFNFKIFANSDLMVYLVDASDVKTLQTITTHYTMTINDGSDGGTVTFVVAPLNTQDVLLVRSIPQTQATDIPAVGQLTEAQIENQMDKEVMMIQEMQEQLDRTLQIDVADDDAPSPAVIPKLVSGGLLSNDGTDLTWTTVAGTGDMLLAGVQIVGATKTFNPGTLAIAGSSSGLITLNTVATATGAALIFPSSADTVVLEDFAQTLTGKTMVGGATNTFTGIVATDSLSATGTKNSTTFLRGDDTWDVPALTAGYAAIHGNNLSANVTSIGNVTPVIFTLLDTNTVTAVNCTVDLGAGAKSIQVTNAGDYRVSFDASFSGGSTGKTYLFGIYKNDSATALELNVRHNSTIIDTHVHINGILTLAATDTLNVQLLSDSGTGLTIGAGARNAFASFAVNRIS